MGRTNFAVFKAIASQMKLRVQYSHTGTCVEGRTAFSLAIFAALSIGTIAHRLARAYSSLSARAGHAHENITISILKEDLPSAPLTNTPATLRGLSLRVISVNDADTFWTVQLVQPKA